MLLMELEIKGWLLLCWRYGEIDYGLGWGILEKVVEKAKDEKEQEFRGKKKKTEILPTRLPT